MKNKNDIETQGLTIEVISGTGANANDWESARDVVVDCFIHLLKEKVHNNPESKPEEYQNETM